MKINKRLIEQLEQRNLFAVDTILDALPGPLSSDPTHVEVAGDQIRWLGWKENEEGLPQQYAFSWNAADAVVECAPYPLPTQAIDYYSGHQVQLLQSTVSVTAVTGDTREVLYEDLYLFDEDKEGPLHNQTITLSSRAHEVFADGVWSTTAWASGEGIAAITEAGTVVIANSNGTVVGRFATEWQTEIDWQLFAKADGTALYGEGENVNGHYAMDFDSGEVHRIVDGTTWHINSKGDTAYFQADDVRMPRALGIYPLHHHRFVFSEDEPSVVLAGLPSSISRSYLIDVTDQGMLWMAETSSSGLEPWLISPTGTYQLAEFGTGKKGSDLKKVFDPFHNRMLYENNVTSKQYALLSGQLKEVGIEPRSSIWAGRLTDGRFVGVDQISEAAGREVFIRDTPDGDVNMDTIFDSNDLVQLFQSGKYEKDEAFANWHEGDFDGDGLFTSSDLVKALETGYSA